MMDLGDLAWHATLEDAEGNTVRVDIRTWGDDVVVLEDGPRVWSEPWAVWDDDWELIGTQTRPDDQCVLTAVRISDASRRLITQITWPTRPPRDLLPDHRAGAQRITEMLEKIRRSNQEKP